MIIGIAAAAIVVVGILLALLLTPVTTFLFGGSGDEFRNTGTCSARRESPSPTPDDSIVVVDPTSEAQSNTPEPTVSASPTTTPAPYDVLYEQADTSMMKDIVNILLIGVDFSEERLTWNGKKEWHSDVMMVLSVNFEENRADLISLPRDTYAKIPNINGIYKLNASINCGGGLYNDDGSVNPKGLEKVCEAAEWMLGGIPVDYYYAVTMTSLKSLVDAFGGLDYDLDLSFQIQGRSYVKGMQHMDGQAVLDYCRVRKVGNGLSSSEAGDANRVNRQKRILVAFFEQMQKDNLIVKIPDILAAFKGELFTNCTAGQTAALAAFAYNLDRNNIGLYSMSGSSSSLFQWNFTFTDQSNRVDIIEKVYGVKAKRYTEYTLAYGRYRWASMLYDRYVELCDPLEDYVQDRIDEDDLLPEFTASPEPIDTQPSTDVPTDVPTEAPTEAPTQTATQVPTPDPTEPPTPKPTKEPTPEPTEPPTPKPTKEPTQEPTEAPTPTPVVSLSMRIKWEDNDDAEGLRPKEFPVIVLKNGDRTNRKTVIKPDKNGKWEADFSSLPEMDENGTPIVYTVDADGKEQIIKDLKEHYTFEAASAENGYELTCKRKNATTPARGRMSLLTEQTRVYTAEQRALFEQYKTALAELKSCKKDADREAQKAKKGKSNQLNAVSVSYLSKLAEVQTLAIRVATEFGYTKVKNFTVPFAPTGSGWNSGSPWAVNYGLDRKFNEVRVDFN